jgi:hypothetical protein
MPSRRRDRARVLLGGIRLVNGAVALLTPWLIVRRFGDSADDHPVSAYALRLFGIRTILVAIDLFGSDGPVRSHAIRMAPLIHASDTVAAVLAARSGRMPARSAVAVVAISAANTALALVMRDDARPESRFK